MDIARELESLAASAEAERLPGTAETIRRGVSQLERMQAALREAEDTLKLAERIPHQDPKYHDVVDRLGRMIGYGALMTTAQRGWRNKLEEDGNPLGGEFVAGPCYATVQRTLSIVRGALAGDGECPQKEG